MAKRESRIQKKNQAAILDAGLMVFSQYGFRGSTLDQIAAQAGLSKPNILYYFSSKDAIYEALLNQLMTDWLDPIHAIDPNGDPIEEIINYARRKMDMSQRFPRESRLFANEIIQGAPQIGDMLNGQLRDTVDRLAAQMTAWMTAGKMRRTDPRHLIFSIWAMTQHYADFHVQVHAIAGDGDHYPDAWAHLEDMLRRTLTPDAA